MSKPRGNTSPADMSLPPHLRGRRRKGRVVVTPPAQMDHATSPRAARQRRDGERWLDAEARAREARDDTGRALAAVLDDEAGLADVMRRVRGEDRDD